MADQPTLLDAEIRRLQRETWWYGAAKCVPAVVTVLSLKIFTQWYDPELFGRYETVMALAMMAGALGTGWLQMALLRLYPEQQSKAQRQELARLVAWLGATVGIGGGALLAVGWGLRNTRWGHLLEWDLLGWVGLVYVCSVGYLLLTSYLRAARQPRLFSLSQIFSPVVALLLGITLTLWYGPGLAALSWASAAGMVSATGVVLLVCWQRWAGQCDCPDADRISQQPKRILKPLLAFGLGIGFHQVGLQALNLSDRYLVLLLCGPHETGLYSVSYRLGDLAVRFVIMVLMLSAYSAVMEVYQHRGRQSAEQLVSKLSVTYLQVALPLVVYCIFFYQPVAELILAPAYHSAAWVMAVVAAADLLLGVLHYQHFGFHLGKQVVRLSLLTWLGVLVNLLLNYLLLPVWGYPAAAWTTLAVYLGLVVVTPALVRPWLCWRIPVREWVSISGAALMMAGTLLVARWWWSTGASLMVLAIQTVVAAGVYWGTLRALTPSK